MLRFLAVLSLYLFAVSIHAEQLVQVYRAEALVTSQSEAQRNAALPESLREVVLRVSGDPGALEHPNVRQALGQAQTYLYEFGYASTDEQLEVDGKLVPATRLLLKFSPPAIEKLLRDSRLSLWPANRPKLLIWLVMSDETGTKHRVPEEEVLKALYDQAGLRGLPLLLPMQDLEDNLALSIENLWNMDELAIKAASERYKADAILIGRYSKNVSGVGRANWQLIHSSGNQSFDTDSADVPGLFTKAIDASADYFARLYAIVPSEEGPGVVIMQVNEVRNFSTYKNLERYLQGLGMVSRVELIVSEKDSLLLRLYTEGDINLLTSTLELGKKLYPVISESVPNRPVTPYRDTTEENWEKVDVEPADSSLAAPDPAQARGSLASPLIYRWQH